MKKPELLLPAGSLSKLKTALLYGADAIYAGTPDLSLRSASSMSLEDLIEATQLVHSMGKKIYLTLNLFARNKDLEKLETFADTIKKIKPDGLIISDLGVFRKIKKLLSDEKIELHVSTQANICSSDTVQMWQDLGASLCVLAREVSFLEFCEIRKDCPDIKLEIFVHGAMCMAFSGRCLISNFLTGRPANRGACAQSCRWNYKVYVEEEKREGEFFPLEEDEHGSYLMSSKDLCLMPHIDKILSSGADSLKVEGRNKNEYYVAVVARAYRNAIDSYFENPQTFDYKPFMRELYTLQNRGYTEAFFHGNASEDSMTYTSPISDGEWRVIGRVVEWLDDGLLLNLKNPVIKNDEIEFLIPNSLENKIVVLSKILDGKTRKEFDRLAPGQQDSLLFIDTISLNGLNKDNLPVCSVARKYVGAGYLP